MLANLVLLVHFGLSVFISLDFIIIPFGYKLGWTWTQNWNLRVFHLLIMGVITLETAVGLTCPSTILENSLRGSNHSATSVGY